MNPVLFLAVRIPHIFHHADASRLTFLGHSWPLGLGVKNFPSDNSKLAEMEFYLVSDLECDLVVFHPYRTLMAICGREGGKGSEQEAGELGFGVNDGPRYWGTGEGKLMLHESAFQNVW